ncbi:Divalent metal cation transporter MntH [Dirofilaria immitis]
MPIVSRTTVTTTRTSGFRSSTIPVWVIKLLTVIIALVVILLIYLQDKGIRASYSTTFIIIALTCGLLLGWSIGSVLQQIFFIRTVEIIVNTILTVLAICSLIVAVSFLLERSDWSRYENYRLMVGTAICFLIQSIVCIMMLSWAFYGNLVIVESR